MRSADRIRHLEQQLADVRRQRDDALDVVRRQDAAAGSVVSDLGRYARVAVLAVAKRYEERADKLIVRNGAHVALVEDYRARAEELREVLGLTGVVDFDGSEMDVDADLILEDLIGTNR